ncbi:hypothetical protein C8Q80DRAFT_872305 [Daedaleopsis nitida]|nr:hypothetical protein C8Q80DRAFT_872305 [Daedaleopsis nitida]
MFPRAMAGWLWACTRWTANDTGCSAGMSHHGRGISQNAGGANSCIRGFGRRLHDTTGAVSNTLSSMIHDGRCTPLIPMLARMRPRIGSDTRG